MIDPPSLAAIRFGFGLPLPEAAPVEARDMLALLSGPDQAVLETPAPGLSDVLSNLQLASAGRKMIRADADAREMYDEAKDNAIEMAETGIKAGFVRALESRDGFRERLVRFWADHFTTKSRNPPERPLPGTLVEDAIRPNLTGRFEDLLIAAALHPAMLVYLDQVASVGPGSVFGRRRKRGLNENLAREVMELHTLGVGAGYSQTDVRQMALLLTGLDANAEQGFVFRTRRAEPGAETVLGKTYAGEGLEPIHAVLRDLARRPETALHIARKLAVHFVSDQPEAGMVAAMASAYRDTGGELMAVYTAMLNHPAAWQGPLVKARQPVDFILAALRALGVNGDTVMGMPRRRFRRGILQPMALMGQPWLNPVGPDGWAEGEEAWITPQGLAARIAWGMAAPGQLVGDLPDPVAFARRALGSAADERLIWAAARAETLREGVGLVLASPAFNRR